MDVNLNRSIFKGLIITNIILILLLFATNLAWLIYELQYENVVVEDTQTVQDIQTVRDVIQN